MRTIFYIIGTLVLTGFIMSTLAQDVSIPDPGLDTAIRDALQKPNGTLTAEDLLTLTNLNACCRTIRSVEGLEGARNLVSLDLQRNRLTSFSLPRDFTNLAVLNLSVNLLNELAIPDGPTNLTTLILEDNQLTNLTLSGRLSGLTHLDVEGNQLTCFNVASNLTSLVFLNLGLNSLTNCPLPNGLTNLATLDLSGNLITDFSLPEDLTGLTTLDLHINELTSFTVPAGLNRLTDLELDENQFSRFTLPAGLTNLAHLDLAFNQITNVSLPDDLGSLTELELNSNHFTRLDLPAGMTNLTFLRLRSNQLTNINLPTDLRRLRYLDLSDNQLTDGTLPAGLSQLATLNLSKNKLTSIALRPGLTNLNLVLFSLNPLTNLTLNSDLTHLTTLNVGGDLLTGLTLPEGLTNLIELVLTFNQVTNLTVPPDMTRLVTLDLAGNPLTTVVLSQPLAATNLAETVAALRTEGVSVFTYPLTIQLTSPRLTAAGPFELTLAAPPGTYTVVGSTDLSAKTNLGRLTNILGSAVFTDLEAPLAPHKFYAALLQGPPANMVFIPPNTFTIGSPTNEFRRQPDEGPPTSVTFSHGFWMAKYLVTQRDYVAVIGANPSGFPGDLNRPVESVSWLDATNYCAKLTLLELAAGRISPGSRFRLPTEAEWECAARAGTSTRYYYGDDPDATDLANHAWFGANGGPTTHPVGLKEPNAWGLYDMEGNVWEWCQDWYGPYPGGTETDPQGPASNPDGVKIIRGGAWESFESDCRSARRMTKAVSPFITDVIIGFRIVLATDP